MQYKNVIIFGILSVLASKEKNICIFICLKNHFHNQNQNKNLAKLTIVWFSAIPCTKKLHEKIHQ